ncbi:MAG: hypothetical protein U9R20_05895, partial [Thermodesulfobacteriota bacterium]|nr:hypothetical protein [Thermodesulfobacteriota bacterium]
FRVLLPPQRRADLCTKIPKVTKIAVKIIMSAHKKLHFSKSDCDKSIDLRLCQDYFSTTYQKQANCPVRNGHRQVASE